MILNNNKNLIIDNNSDCDLLLLWLCDYLLWLLFVPWMESKPNAQDIKPKIKTLRKSSEREQQKYKLPIDQNYDKWGQLTKVFGRLVDVWLGNKNQVMYTRSDLYFLWVMIIAN